MQSGNLLYINLAQAAEAAECLEFELSDRFFADLEQEEISGGDVHVQLSVRASAGDIYKVEIEAEGQVTVPCDRCLDALMLPVEAAETLRIKDADPSESDDPEMLYLDAGNPCFDLSWQIYEILATALPLQRVHPDGECNHEVTDFILTPDDSEEEE